MAVKYLVSDKSGDHLPYSDASGSPDHRLMGAAWAALHGGYRGNKYAGPNKQDAIDKLTAVYKREKMDTPQESFLVPESKDSLLYEADGITPKAQSFDAIRCQVQSAIQAEVDAGADMDLDGDDDSNCYVWISDLYPTMAIYSLDGALFQIPYHIEGDQVILGTPVEVEMSYTVVPSDSAADAAEESYRILAGDVSSFREAAYDEAAGALTLTVIKPGFNLSKQRYYPAAVLKRDAHIFEGAKMFADHQSEREEKERPEGSVHNYVGNIKKVWAESDGTVKANAIVIDPTFKAKLAELNKQNMLGEMGVSIRAIGEATKTKIEGTDTNYIESLIRARSVDFVTYAGAGGQVEAMESDSNNENDLDLVSESELRKRRPELVALIESHAQKDNATMKSMEQQLQEANTQLADAKTKLTAAEAKIQESEKATKKATAAAELVKLLTESKLPEKAQERLKKQFAEALTSDGMKEAIEFEKDYLKSIAPTSAVVRNMGNKDNGVTESDHSSRETNLVETFKRLPGMSDKEAEIAARGRAL